MDELITVNDAAKELGLTPMRVRQLIAKKHLRARKLGMQYLIQHQDLDAVRKRNPRGRPAGLKRKRVKK